MTQQARQHKDRRNGKRLAINEEVFDQKSGKSIGHTADLNANEMMLVGSKEFIPGEKTRISLDIPNANHKKTRTSLLAQCRWSEPHLNTLFLIPVSALFMPLNLMPNTLRYSFMVLQNSWSHILIKINI